MITGDRARTRRGFARQDLIEEWLGSDASRTLKRLKVFELTLRIFRMNFDEWERTIEERRPANPIEALRMMSDSRWVEEYLVELTRTFHNFVASTLSLLDHTRVFYKELYEPNNLLPDYQAQINSRFANDGRAEFIKGMRQFFQHKRLPLVNVQLGVHFDSRQDAQTKWGVPINKTELLTFKRWNATARRFIEQQGHNLDLQEVARRYRENVDAFHEWFTAQQQAVHAADFAAADEVARRLNGLSDPPAAVDALEVEEQHGFSDDEIRPVAYAIWDEDGRPWCREDEHWRMAIEQLKARRDAAE